MLLKAHRKSDSLDDSSSARPAPPRPDREPHTFKAPNPNLFPGRERGASGQAVGGGERGEGGAHCLPRAAFRPAVRSAAPAGLEAGRIVLCRVVPYRSVLAVM